MSTLQKQTVQSNQTTMGRRIVEQLDHLLSNASEAKNRIEQISDRVFGLVPQPPADGSKDVRSLPDTLEAEIFSRLSQLANTLDAQHGIIDRLNNI